MVSNVSQKFLGFTFSREGFTLDSKSFLEDVTAILSKHNGGFKIFNVFTDKTFYYYEGMVFLNSDKFSATQSEAQQYFEEQLLLRESILESL